MKGVFLSGRDKFEANILKDIALSLHEEFDSIEIRYPGSDFKADSDSFFVMVEGEAENLLKNKDISPKSFEIIARKDLNNVEKLRDKIKKSLSKVSK